MSKISDLQQPRLDFKMKFEGDNVPKLRKKVCRKIFKTLMEKYSIEKVFAKSVAMNLEFRINTTFNHETQNKLYFNSLKKFLKYLEKVDNKFDELSKVQRMPLDKFNTYIVSINS